MIFQTIPAASSLVSSNIYVMFILNTHILEPEFLAITVYIWVISSLLIFGQLLLWQI